MIERHQEPGGVRFYVDGVALHCGDGIEVQLDNGQWTDFRFEWSHHPEDRVTLYFSRSGCLQFTPNEFEALRARLPKPRAFRGML
jgi:hypothetical protein